MNNFDNTLKVDLNSNRMVNGTPNDITKGGGEIIAINSRNATFYQQKGWVNN